MNQQKKLIRISELLGRFKYEVAILNANAQLDINIISEDILIPILNIIYESNLINANYSENNNFPAIDLIDKSKRLAFQITSTSNISKVKKTLEGIVKNNFHKEFDDFYIYIITEKQKNYNQAIIDQSNKGILKFTKNNILDEKDLYKKISSLEFSKIEKIEELLEQQFSDKTYEVESQKQLYKIIESFKLKIDHEICILELENLYQTKKGWIEKKYFLESKLPYISNINQEFSIGKDLEDINLKISDCDSKISKILLNNE